MELMSLVRLVNSQLDIPVYPLQFPFNSDIDNCCVLDVIQGTKGEVSTVILQLMSRSVLPVDGEQLLNNAIEKLHNQTDLEWEGFQVILITCENTNPFFLGLDKDKKYLYHTQFKMLVSKN